MYSDGIFLYIIRENSKGISHDVHLATIKQIIQEIQHSFSFHHEEQKN